MSVIAKMNVVSDPRDFGSAQLVELQCVCDNQLMSAYSRENENYTFNQASPSGDARITLTKDTTFRQFEELYLIFVRNGEVPAFPDALATVKAWCNSITDFGGTSRRVDVSSEYRDYRHAKEHPQQVDQFSLRMMIDNPAASVQFEPGKHGYWIGIYRASEMSMAQALALAAT